MIQTDNILISLMNRKTYNNVKIFIIALTLCLIAVPVSRYLSPRAIVNGHDVYLAWLPLSVMLAVILLFGRRAILPILLGFTVTNLFYINLAPLQYSVLLFCQTFALFAACGLLRLMLGKRWRHSIPNKHIGLRIFWLGFIVPFGIKLSMYMAGYLFDFPVTISTYFGEGTVIYNVVDIQSLICAGLIFTMMFYYPLRMIINPRYAVTFWRRSVKPVFYHKNPLYIFVWLMLLGTILIILCGPFESPVIAGYLMPLIFILLPRQ